MELSTQQKGIFSEQFKDEGIYINPEYYFDDSGFLQRYEIVVEKPGTIEFWVIFSSVFLGYF